MKPRKDAVSKIFKKLNTLVIFLLVTVFLFFNSTNANAQTCGSLGENRPPNHFTCSAINGLWQVNEFDFECDNGYTPNFTLCSGNYAQKNLCGETNCCLACVRNEETSIPYGEPCGGSTQGECVNGTECREGLCLRSEGTIAFGNSCLRSSECSTGTSENPTEALVCREVSGRGRICTYVEGRYCESDRQCITETGNPLSRCIADVCTNPGEQEDDSQHKGTAFEYCDQVPPSQRDDCRTCIADSTNEQGVQTRIYTAVGCIDVVGSDLAADLIRILIGVAGTAAFLSILGAAFLLTTSAGESSKVKQAKELLTAAVAGLLFMIFSVIILDFIGVSVLNIPGLTGGTRTQQPQEYEITPSALSRPQLHPSAENPAITCDYPRGCICIIDNHGTPISQNDVCQIQTISDRVCDMQGDGQRTLIIGGECEDPDGCICAPNSSSSIPIRCGVNCY